MKKKILVISCISGALETFDFFIYAAFFNVIASTFFPATNKLLSLFMSLSGFGIAFVMRPLGALIFGYFGDVFGRKQTLIFALALMGFPTFMIGILPSYDEIGIISPFFIIVGRLIQGICYGGEFNGTLIFALEHTQKKPGFVSGLILSSCVFGVFVATLLSHITQLPGMPSWAWRVPFLMGSVIVLVGYFIRKNLTETEAFLREVSKKTVPFLTTLRTRKAACFLCFSIGALIGGLFYIDFGFLNIYLSRYCHMSLSNAREMNIFSILAFILACPFFGILYDRMTLKMHASSFLRRMSYGLFFGIFPVFWMIISPHPLLSLLGITTLGICTASVSAVGFPVMQNLFSVRERYRGISLFYSLGVVLSGGMAPILYIEAIEVHKESLMFPAYCLMCLVGLFYGALLIYNAAEANSSLKIQDQDDHSDRDDHLPARQATRG